MRALGVEVEVSPLFNDGYTAVAAEPRAWRHTGRRLLVAAEAYTQRAVALLTGGPYDLVAEEWIATLRDLARSAALRARLGRAGRRTVEERHSLEAWTPRLAALYRGAAAST